MAGKLRVELDKQEIELRQFNWGPFFHAVNLLYLITPKNTHN